MSLRTKILVAVVFTMLLTTTLLTLNLVLYAFSQSDRYQDSQAAWASGVVEEWVEVVFPAELTPEQAQRRLQAFAPQATPADPEAADPGGQRVEDGAEGAQPAGLFERIEWIDRYRRRHPQPNGPPVEKSYDPLLAEAIATGEMRIRDRTIYRPLTRTVTYPSRRASEREVIGVLAFELGLDQAPPGPSRDLMSTVFWIMGLGTILLIVAIFLLVSRFVLRPLDRLVGVSKSIAVGNYDAAPLDLAASRFARGSDEIATLMQAFDSMLQEVRHTRNSQQQEIDAAIREHRRAEQALIIAQRLAATGTLAAGIAHEINNPLQGMQNAVRRLRTRLESHLDDRGRDYLDLISEGLGRIQEIVRQVLDVSRRKVNPAPFDMREPVERAAALVEHKASRANTTVTLEPPDRGGNHAGASVSDAPLGSPTDETGSASHPAASERPRPASTPLCFGDRAEIQQVLTNLLLNAIDAIKEAQAADSLTDGATSRAGQVRIQWGPVDDGIEAIVRDNGIGMSEQQATQAFDAFFTTKQEGTGLGLAIIHNIIDSHGGSIRLESAPGRGTTIRFTIPRYLEDDERATL